MFTRRETRLQDKTNREQNSIEIESDPGVAENSILFGPHNGMGKKTNINDQRCTVGVQLTIENNIAKEQARVVLPEGLTMSRMYMNGTL